MKLARIKSFKFTRGLDSARHEIGQMYYVEEIGRSTWVNDGKTYMIHLRKDGIPTNLTNCVISSKDIVFGNILND